MDPEAIPDWASSFAAFCARFDDLFTRSESRTQARKYLRGLLAGLERKTSWQLAEVVQDGTPDRMQRLLYACSIGRRGMRRPRATACKSSSSSALVTRRALASSMRPASPNRASARWGSRSSSVAPWARSRPVRWRRC